MVKINLDDAVDNILDLVGSLTYLNYCHNRRQSPDITPEQWLQVYGDDTYKFETLYQLEKEGTNE